MIDPKIIQDAATLRELVARTATGFGVTEPVVMQAVIDRVMRSSREPIKVATFLHLRSLTADTFTTALADLDMNITLGIAFGGH